MTLDPLAVSLAHPRAHAARLGVAAAVALSAFSLAAPAVAIEPGSVCILEATETITPPKRPNEFTMRLDCGRKPAVEEAALIGKVNAMTSTPEAIEALLAAGYELEDATTRTAWSGHAIVTHMIFISEGEAEAEAPAGEELPEESLPEEDESLDAAPESEAL